MASTKPKKNKLTKAELSKQKRKEIIQDLLPLGKSFALWIVLVAVVAIDYTGNRWFSMIFVEYTTHLTIGLSKILQLPVELLSDGVSQMTTLDVNYKTISISNFPMIIELECSAYHAYLALIALVLFSKWSAKFKLIAGAILFASLSLINSLRIILLGVIGAKNPEIFNIMHDYVWNILLVIAIWAMWELANKKHEAILKKQQTDEETTS